MRDLDAVIAIAGKYFDALYDGDAELFAEIFHPQARLFSCTNDDPVKMDVRAYLDLVRGRTSPADRGDPRCDEILSIELASPTTAHLRVRELFLPKRFTDELTLMKQAGRWSIVSKVWDFELIEGQAR